MNTARQAWETFSYDFNMDRVFLHEFVHDRRTRVAWKPHQDRSHSTDPLLSVAERETVTVLYQTHLIVAFPSCENIPRERATFFVSSVMRSCLLKIPQIEFYISVCESRSSFAVGQTVSYDMTALRMSLRAWNLKRMSVCWCSGVCESRSGKANIYSTFYNLPSLCNANAVTEKPENKRVFCVSGLNK